MLYYYCQTNHGGLMTTNKFKELFDNSGYHKLLSEDSQFYSDDCSFAFVFQPTDPRDPEMVEAERMDLAARFDVFVGQWTGKLINRFLDGSIEKDAYKIEMFDKKLYEEFSTKVFVVFLAKERHSYREDYYLIKSSNSYERNSKYRDYYFAHMVDVYNIHEEFRKLIFGESFHLFHDYKKLSSLEASRRLKYAKAKFPNLVDEESDLYLSNEALRKGLRNKYYYTKYYDREEGSKNWFKIILENYRSFLSDPVLKELEKKYDINIKTYSKFSNFHGSDIVSIADYMSSNELQAQGKSLKQAIIEARLARDSHDSTFRTDLLFENQEAKFQNVFAKDVVQPAREVANTFGTIHLPENHTPYEDAKQSIIENREEQKRLREMEKEKKRQEELARREQERLARIERLKEDKENFLTMLRDSGHGHGHKDREGNEKLWYETEALAADDALKLAKKSNRLLKPYRVTLHTEMDQTIYGWFLTTAVSSKQAA